MPVTLDRIKAARDAGHDDDAIVKSISKFDPELAEGISKAQQAGRSSSAIMKSIEKRLSNVKPEDLPSFQSNTTESPNKLDNPQGITLAPEENPSKTDNVKQLDNAKGWMDHFAKGMERSVSGGAKESELTEDPGFWSGLVEFAGETLGDLPYMAAGGSLGAILGAEAGAVGGPFGAAAGGVLGGGFGSLALPTFLKQAMKEYRDYAKQGHDITFGEFLERADRVASESLKSGVMGMILGQVSKAAPLLKEAPGIGKLFTTKLGQKVGEVGLETATLGTIPKVSQGELPTKRDYAEALAQVLGFKVAKLPSKIREGVQRLGEESGLSPEEFLKSFPKEEIIEVAKRLKADPEAVTRNLKDIDATILKSTEEAKARNLKDRITYESENVQKTTNELAEDLPKGNKKNLAKKAIDKGWIRSPEQLNLFLDEYESTYESLPGKTGKDKNRKFMNRYASENNVLENVKPQSGKPVVDIKPTPQRKLEIGVQQIREANFEGDKAKRKEAKKRIDLAKRKLEKQANQKTKEAKESKADVKQLDIPEEPSSFTTAKGSTYEVHEDGSTTRNKKFRPEHGEKEQGPQPRSQVTRYVTKADADKLSLVQTQGEKMKLFHYPDGQIGVQFLSGPNKGKVASNSIVQSKSKPEVGLIPVETLKDGRVHHFGNPITEVKKKPSSSKITVKPAELSVTKAKEEKKPEPITERTGEGAEQRLDTPKTKSEKLQDKASEIIQAAKTPDEVRHRVVTLTFDALEPLNRLESDIPVSERVTTKIKQAQNSASTINTILTEGIFDNVRNRFEPESSLKDAYTLGGELWKKVTKGLKEGEYSLREMDVYRASKEALKRQQRGLKSGIDTDIAKEDVARLKQKYGPIDQRIQQFQAKCLQNYGKDLLSDKTRAEWSRDSHASLYRVMDYGTDALLPQGSLQPKKPWYKAKGSTRKIIPASESDVMNLSMLVSNSKKNESILQYKKGVEEGKLPGKIKESKNRELPRELMEDMELDSDSLDLMETLYNQSRKDAWTPKEGDKGRLRGWEQGKPFEIEVPQDVYETFASQAPTDTGAITNFFKSATRMFSKGVTYEPVKHLSIFGRDAWSSLVYSKTGSNPLSIAKALMDINKNSESWQKFKALGGEQYATRALTRADRIESVEKLLKIESPNVTIVPFNKLANWLSKNASNLAASVPFAEYQRAVKKFGDTPDGRLAALIESKSVSYDPNRKGSHKLVKGIANYLPFFGPMLQEPHMIAQNMKRPMFWAKGAVAFTLPALMLKMFNDGNPDYDDLSPISKTMFYHLYTPLGHIAVPAPWLLGALFKGVPEAMYDTLKGEGGEAWKGLYSYVASQLAGTWNPYFTAVVEQTTNRTLPSPGATILYPFIEADTRAPPVVPRRLENLPPEQQYTSKTSQLARWYGSLWKASPVKVDRLIQTFGGGLAQDALALIDEMAYATGLAEDLRPEQGVKNWLMFGKFLSSNTPTQTKYAKMFYERLETERMAKQRGEKNDYKKYDSYRTKISKLFSKYRDIENQKINPSTKREMLEETQKKINALYKEAIQRGNNA